jgi:hypothetical protein
VAIFLLIPKIPPVVGMTKNDVDANTTIQILFTLIIDILTVSIVDS